MKPNYYNPTKVEEIYSIDTAKVIDEANEYKKNNSIESSNKDTEKVGLFLIDVQNDFCDPSMGSLFVPGSENDNINICNFIYDNVAKISNIYLSLDTHFLFQIFHPSWWMDSQGNPPPPFTLISYEDLKQGKWLAKADPKGSLAYCQELESVGKKQLCIWPYHCLLGSTGHAVNSCVQEAVLFQQTVKMTPARYEIKGNIANTENYSVLSPEVKKQVPGGSFNADFYQALISNDKLYIAGQAAIHCVLETVKELERERGGDKNLLSKIYILRDCMSPVPAVEDGQGNVLVDFPKIALDALDGWEKNGMNVVRSTDTI